MAIAVGLLCHMHSLASATRRQVRAWRRQQRQLERQHAREYCLEAARARRAPYLQRVAVVHELESAASQVVERYRLFALLATLSDLEVIRHHCLGVRTLPHREELVRRAEELTRWPEQEILRELAERRLSYWTERAEAARRCDEQTAVITELIEALRLRGAIPELPGGEAAVLAASSTSAMLLTAAHPQGLPSPAPRLGSRFNDFRTSVFARPRAGGVGARGPRRLGPAAL